MGKILEFVNKWGKVILIIMSVLIYLSTCGTGGNIDRTNRRLDKMEKTLLTMDTTISTKVSEQEIEILLQIATLETSKRVVYDNNTIVRTTKRPDDVMDDYDKEIKVLLEKLKTVRKK